MSVKAIDNGYKTTKDCEGISIIYKHTAINKGKTTKKYLEATDENSKIDRQISYYLIDDSQKEVVAVKCPNDTEYLHLCTFKTPIIDAKNKQKVIADFTPRYAYLPIKEYHNRSYSLD